MARFGVGTTPLSYTIARGDGRSVSSVVGRWGGARRGAPRSDGVIEMVEGDATLNSKSKY
eukprot:scaffold127669_cov32-Tisochrysis_lutea.AAC.1